MSLVIDYAVVPALEAAVLADTDDRPLYFPPETVVMYFSMLTQRNDKLWGADADAFDPDRWLDERLARFTENPMMYTPFNAGPRVVSVWFPSSWLLV